MPLRDALASASRSRGSAGPARVMLLARASRPLAQSRPLMMLKVVPSVLADLVLADLVLADLVLADLEPNALTVSSPTRGAVPSMVRRAAIAPAMPVPCWSGAAPSAAS